MADPHFLYVVLAAVVLALVVWVVFVLVKMPAATPFVPDSARRPLPSHPDIQDETSRSDDERG